MFIDQLIKKKPDVSRSAKSHLVSFGKAVSWRIFGTLDTIFISFLITGKWSFAISIGGVEVFTKIFLYYLHERAWLYFGKNEK
jgi:uncharacterized membrane protein